MEAFRDCCPEQQSVFCRRGACHPWRWCSRSEGATLGELPPPWRSGLSSPRGLSWPAGTDAEALGGLPGLLRLQQSVLCRRGACHPWRWSSRSEGATLGELPPPWMSGLGRPAGADARKALGAGRGSGRGSSGRKVPVEDPLEDPARGREVPVELRRGREVPVEVPTARGAGGAGRATSREVGAGRAKTRAGDAGRVNSRADDPGAAQVARREVAGGRWRRRRERRAVHLVSVPMTVRPRTAAGCAGPLPPTLRQRKERRDIIASYIEEHDWW